MKKTAYLIVLLIVFLTSSIFGKEITPKKYKRIVSLTLSGDEMILSLVNSDRIVGLSGKINEDPEISYVVEEAKKFPKVESNIEKMIELDPDLVITADWMKKEILMQIEETGANVYTYKTPKTFEEQKQLIKELANIVDERENGEKIVNNMEQRLRVIQNKIEKNYCGEKLKIMFYTPFETTSGKNTTFDDMVKLIGGINIAAENGIENSEKINKEKVIELDPDIIIIPIWDKYTDGERFLDFFINDISFQDLKAVKSKRVIPVKYKVTAPTSQYMIDGIEVLAKKIYNLEER